MTSFARWAERPRGSQFAYMARASGPAGVAWQGFQWPVAGYVECDDWEGDRLPGPRVVDGNYTPEGGGGLWGYLDGGNSAEAWAPTIQGMGYGATFQVYIVARSEVRAHQQGYCHRAPRGWVLCNGTLDEVCRYLEGEGTTYASEVRDRITAASASCGIHRPRSFVNFPNGRPRIWRNASPLPHAGWVKRITESVTLGPRIAGPVPAHTHDELGHSDRIFGLVLQSEGHALRTESLGSERLELQAGDIYSLDGREKHWTECANPNGRIHVLVTAGGLSDEGDIRVIERRLAFLIDHILAPHRTPEESVEMTRGILERIAFRPPEPYRMEVKALALDGFEQECLDFGKTPEEAAELHSRFQRWLDAR